MRATAAAAARLSLAALTLLTMIACGEPGSGQASRRDAAAEEAAADALGRDTDTTVFDDTIETQDRARAVEDLTLGRKDELDRALESAAGEDPGAAR